jgi:hypothetical protein
MDSTNPLSLHYAASLPDISVPIGTYNIVDGLGHAILGGALIAASAPEVLTLPPVGVWTLATGIGELAAGAVQVGLGFAQQLGAPSVSPSEWDLVSQLASPIKAQAFGVAAFSSGDETTLENFASFLSNVDLVTAIGTLAVGDATMVEKLDSVLTTIDSTFNESLRDSPLFKGSEDSGGFDSTGDTFDSPSDFGDLGDRDADSGSEVG